MTKRNTKRKHSHKGWRRTRRVRCTDCGRQFSYRGMLTLYCVNAPPRPAIYVCRSCDQMANLEG
jgi:hypothetical protein